MPSRYPLALGLSFALHILVAIALMGGPNPWWTPKTGN